jgi:hypothetical protein
MMTLGQGQTTERQARWIMLGMLLVVLFANNAFAQEGMTCTNLTVLNQAACRTTDAGKTTYTISEADASHSYIHVVTESEFDAAIKADSEALATLAAQLHADNVRNEAISRYGKRYFEKALSCVQGGGTWSDMRHTCKAAR